MLFALLSCRPEVAHAVQRPLIDTPAPEPQWPAPGTPLSELPVSAPRNLEPTTIYLMAGHANGRSRTGNLGVHAQVEAEVNLWTVGQLAQRLEELGRFEVIIGRKQGEYPSYRARIRRAERLGADVFIELHTDARCTIHPWAYTSKEWVYRNEGCHGFSVLYNEGSALGPERAGLARAVGGALAETGLPPFHSYGRLYDDDRVPGVFIDRRGLMMLRRPSMPSIIIETHNAKDFEESLRWREERTLDAFASAIAEGVRRYRTPHAVDARVQGTPYPFPRR